VLASRSISYRAVAWLAPLWYCGGVQNLQLPDPDSTRRLNRALLFLELRCSARSCGDISPASIRRVRISLDILPNGRRVGQGHACCHKCQWRLSFPVTTLQLYCRHWIVGFLRCPKCSRKPPCLELRHKEGPSIPTTTVLDCSVPRATFKNRMPTFRCISDHFFRWEAVSSMPELESHSFPPPVQDSFFRCA